MRKLVVAVAIAAAALLVWWLWPAGEAPAPQAAAAPPVEPGQEKPRILPASWIVPRESTPTGTPHLERPAAPEDGALLVEVHAAGEPRKGAQVRLYWHGPRDPNTEAFDWRVAGEGVTDPKGAATIFAAPGSYLVVARVGGLAPARKEVRRPQGEALTRVTLALEPGVSLTGRTLEKSTREPAPLVDLTLAPETSPTSRGRPDVPVEELQAGASDARGAFHFDGLTPGPYLLKARAPGHSPQNQRVTAGGEPIDVLLAAAGVIEGFVRHADGQPAASAEVSAIGGAEAPATATTGPEGGFSIEVPAGKRQLIARVGAEVGSKEAVVVAAGSTTRGIELRLGQAGRILGTVRDGANGSGVAGARVDASPHGSTGDLGRAVSGPDGGYAVEGLAAGAFDLVVNAPGYGEKSELATVLPGQSATVDIVLEASGTIEGTVRDPGGHTLPGIRVLCDDQSGASDSNGHYELKGVAPGHRQVVARRELDTPGVAQSIDVPAGGAAHLDVTLPDSGTLRGRVTRRGAGTLHPSVEVRCWGNTSRELTWTPVDALGTYHVDLPAGAYRCWASDNDRQEVTIEAERTTTADFTYSDAEGPDAGVFGTVLEPDGTPSPGATVRLTIGRTFSQAYTNEQGRFSLMLTPSADPVSASLFARNGGRQNEQPLNNVPPQLEIRLNAAATIRGHLRPRDGSTVDGFSVDVQYKSTGPPRFSNSLLGRAFPFSGDTCELHDLPADALILTVTTRDGRAGRAEVTPTAGSTAEVEIPIDPAATVRGRLLDQGQPLPGAFVVADDNWSGRTLTRADGTFSVPFSAGPHKIQWWASGPYEALVRRLTFQTGQVLDLGDLVLKRRSAPDGGRY